MTQAAAQTLPLARSLPPVLAVGAWFKNTVCVTRGAEAFLSAGVGDLADAAACRAFEAAVDDMLASLQVAPRAVAHDLHPDFHSTRFALEFAAERELPAIGVQHHHAHIAAIAAEHHVDGPLLGLALDGVGLGTDGSAWGGELLYVDGVQSRRLGHLRPLALPGGDRAAREPWRMAVAALYALGRHEDVARRYPGARGATLLRMLERGVNCPVTSSAGRVFDAAAGLLGICTLQTFEGEAPMLLERLAARHGTVAPLPGAGAVDAEGRLDLLPLLECMARVEPSDADAVGRAAAEFHATLAMALADWVGMGAAATGVSRVAFGGGCFHNRVLGAALRARLEADGFEVLEASRLPPSDSGLALGQAWVAAQGLR